MLEFCTSGVYQCDIRQHLACKASKQRHPIHVCKDAAAKLQQLTCTCRMRWRPHCGRSPLHSPWCSRWGRHSPTRTCRNRATATAARHVSGCVSLRHSELLGLLIWHMPPGLGSSCSVMPLHAAVTADRRAERRCTIASSACCIAAVGRS
jgi:hypothetical protein